MRNQVSLRRRQASRVRNFKIGAFALLGVFAFVLVAVACQGALVTHDLGSSVAALPFLGLGGLMFMEAAKGPTAGGAATCPEPTGDTLEAKLESSKNISADFFTQLAGAMTERDQAVGELAGTKQNVTDLTTERDGLKTQVTDLTTERDGLKTTVTGLTTERDTAKSRVTLIESFCKGKGIDLAGIEKSQAAKDIPGAGPATGSEGKAHYEQWQALKKTDSKKAAAYFRKNKSDIQEYAESTAE